MVKSYIKDREQPVEKGAPQQARISTAPGPDRMSPKGWTPATEQRINIHGTDTEILPDLSTEPLTPGVDSQRVQEFNRVLAKYKAGKASIDQRTIEAENWWKMRNSFKGNTYLRDKFKALDLNSFNYKDFKSVTGWLHNVIVSKHADAVEAYPAYNILPREEGDKTDAWALGKIIPVVLEQNEFEKTYSDCMWQKLKTGTCVYMVTWDNEKLGGLGDVAIKRASILNVFWEPGVDDIQESRFFFHVASEDKDILRMKYPEALANDPVMQNVISRSEIPHDDAVDKTNKVDVIDVYYKKNGKLHFCKYVGSTVLYATENDPERRERGLYDHGMFPFVFDCLFPVEESPAGYGYVDICFNAQIRIDLMSTASLKNTLAGATPRYFSRVDGAVNEEEFLDLNNPLIHVSGNLGEDSLRAVAYNPLHGNYLNMLNATVDELRETSSNTETSTGSSTNGVTAASALAALQEAAGKTSRDSTKSSYRASRKVVNMLIELIRQFYDIPRQFRITGTMGVDHYISYSNQGIKPQAQGTLGTLDLGNRVPVFDIYVVPEKESSYTKLARNEMALQFFRLGFFNPNMTDQALMCLNMMDFDGKEELMQKLSQQGTMYQQLQLYQAMAATLAAKHEPQMVAGLLNGSPQPMPKGGGDERDIKDMGEPSNVSKARERAATAAQPGGSTA